MTTLLLDTHVIHWWSAEPQRLSQPAADALSSADELAVAAISWFELAWLATHERIVVSIPVRSWLSELAARVRTVGITTFPDGPDSLVAVMTLVAGNRPKL